MALSLLKLQRAALRVQKLIIDRTGRSGQVYFEHRVAEYREMWRAIAAARGGSFTELAPDLWEIRVGGPRLRILNHELEFDNPVTLGLAGRKSLVHRLLGDAGLAVPRHAVFTLRTSGDASRFLAAHPRGCVVKPSGGYGGKGVTTHVLRPAELRRAALLASLYDSELLIEEQVPGESYRLLVLEGRVIHAVCRRGPRLRGDGVATVRQLLRAENQRRGQAGVPPIDVDRDCLFTLAYQGLTLDSRPEDGQAVVIKSVNDTARRYSEVRTVYTETATHLLCDSIRKDAELAARIVGSDFLGVDVITPDPTVPLARSGGVINEVNTTPALHHHYDASREAYPAAGVLVLDALVRRQAAAVARVSA